MPRMRVRLSEWEIGFVDLACAYYGLARGEYIEHLVRGIPCVPQARVPPAMGRRAGRPCDEGPTCGHGGRST